MRILSHPRNFLFSPDDNGLLEMRSDLVALYDNKRILVPAGTKIKKLKARRGRAVLIRRAVKGKLSPYKVDEAFCAALRHDGAKNVRATRVGLYLLGLLRYQWRYKKEPKNANA